MTFLSVAFSDEEIPTTTIDLVRSPLDGVDAYETPEDVAVALPGGGEIHVSAEVYLGTTPDVSISVLEGDHCTCAVRCTSGVVISYVSRSGVEVLIQVGTGPWE